jgi:hypothetical protein
LKPFLQMYIGKQHFDILCKGVTKFELTNNKNSCLALFVHSLIGVLSG